MSDSQAPRSFLQKACENCRLRKIRCDKQTPCSSCQTLGIACQAASTRAAEHRPRIVVTNQYERQISLIQERLQGIESSLKQLSQNPSSATPRRPSYRIETPASTSQPDSSISVYEGDSSFGNQTIQASQLADVTANTVVGPASNELSNALYLLKGSLKRHEALSRTHETHLSRRIQNDSLASSQLPPAALVIALINRAKDAVQPPFSLVAFACRGVSQLETLCQKLYFPLEPLPAGSITFFYGLLFFIIRDYWSQQDEVLDGYDAQAYIDLCEAKFCSGLENFETLTVPVLQNIQALLIGATKAQEECKLSLSWTFLSAAATMCHTLGYHRKSTLSNEDAATADIKRHVFWQLYSLDKNLSLNLGRGSNFSDSDIDAEFSTPSANPKQRPWDMMALATIVFAKVQGQVYEKLYSASALTSSLEERSAAIDELSTQLCNLRDELISIDVSGAHYHERLQGIFDTADFISNSVLTVIYRAAPPTNNPIPLNPHCHSFALHSLQSHLRCFAQFKTRNLTQQSEYVHWILLYPSFTPFIVVFIHAIAERDIHELNLLQQTVESLEFVAPLSPAAKRLHDICAAFLNVASAFMKTRRGEGVDVLRSQDMGVLDGECGGRDGDLGVEGEKDVLSVFLCSLAANNRPLTDFLHMDLLDDEFGLSDF